MPFCIDHALAIILVAWQKLILAAITAAAKPVVTVVLWRYAGTGKYPTVINVRQIDSTLRIERKRFWHATF